MLDDAARMVIFGQLTRSDVVAYHSWMLV